MKYLYIISFFFLCSCGSKEKQDRKFTIVTLHGYNGSSKDFEEFSKSIDDSIEIKNLEGFFPIDEKRSSWADIKKIRINNSWFNEKDTYYSTVKIREILKGIDNEIILVGESQGATIGYSLIIRYPDFFKYLVSINGFVDSGSNFPRTVDDYSNVKILSLNATNDFIVTEEMLKYSTEYLNSLKIENTLVRHNEGHTYTTEEIKIFVDWINNLKE